MVRIVAVDRDAIESLSLSDRFRLEIVYFMTPSDAVGAPKTATDEYWIRMEDTKRWLDDGVISIVSPLDAESVADIELSEEQERFLEWLLENDVQHVRVVRT